MSESKPIPQMDLAAQYAAIGGEIREAVTQVLTSQQFVLGKEGAALEREIAELCGVQHGIGVACGKVSRASISDRFIAKVVQRRDGHIEG